MTFGILLIGLLASWMMGTIVVRLFSPPQGLPTLLEAAMGLGVGIAVHSCVMFAWVGMGGSLQTPTALAGADSALVLAAFALAVLAVKRGWVARPVPRMAMAQPNWKFAGPALAVAMIACAVAAHWWWDAVLSHPQGEWDAWMIWNLKARFFYRGGPLWSRVFTDLHAMSHPDYPLLLPMSIARLWTYLHAEAPLVPIALSAIFAALTALVLFASLAVQRSVTQASLAVAALLASAFFITGVSNQCADTALGFYILAAFAVLSFARRAPLHATRLHVLAGLIIGCTLWTKNEGVLFALVMFILVTATNFIADGRATALRRAGALLAGASPVILIAIFFKLHFGGAGDIVTAVAHTTLTERAFDPARHRLIFQFFSGLILHGDDACLKLLCLAFAFAAGLSPQRADRPTLFILASALLVMFVGYYAVYLLSPHDLLWHLSTSLSRLFCHFWPSAVFLLFLAVRTPEECAEASVSSPHRGDVM